jgi:uncharacterized membrane protein YhaH (DUF805 family)
MLEGYFSLDGRIRRRRFFRYSLALLIIIVVLTLLAVAALDNARNRFIAGILAFVVIAGFWAWAGFSLVVKRLHDLDKPGWHYVWMFLLPGLLTGGFSVHGPVAAVGPGRSAMGRVGESCRCSCLSI